MQREYISVKHLNLHSDPFGLGNIETSNLGSFENLNPLALAFEKIDLD